MIMIMTNKTHSLYIMTNIIYALRCIAFCHRRSYTPLPLKARYKLPTSPFCLCSFPFHSLLFWNNTTMVGTSLDQQLKNFISSMHDQGILDHNFENVRRLQTQGNPQFITEVVTMFINDADVSMTETTRVLNEPEVDYETLTGYLHQLRGSSSSIGGCRMALACRELRQAVDVRDKARCLEAFDRVKQEYQTLRDSFNHILQLERSILSYESRRRQA